MHGEETQRYAPRMSREPLDEPSGLSTPEEPPSNKPTLGERLRAWLRRLTGR
jgi:hypothetical protein